MFAYIMATVQRLLRSDSAQDAFEYLLVIGGVSVLVIAAMATPVGTNLANAVVDGVCSAINTVMNPDVVCP